jgi:hypothetical protein
MSFCVLSEHRSVIGWSVRKPLFLETFGHGLHARHRVGITDASPSRDRTNMLIIIVSIIFFSECLYLLSSCLLGRVAVVAGIVRLIRDFGECRQQQARTQNAHQRQVLQLIVETAICLLYATAETNSPPTA